MRGANTNIYTIVERSRIKNVVEEQKLSLSGFTEDSDAARVGELLGVDAMIIGTVHTNFEESYKTEDVHKLKGMKIKKTGTESCKIRKAEAHASYRILDFNTGEIILTKEVSRKKEDKKCGDSMSKIATKESLIDGCLKDLGTWDLPNYFNPYLNLKNLRSKIFK